MQAVLDGGLGTVNGTVDVVIVVLSMVEQFVSVAVEVVIRGVHAAVLMITDGVSVRAVSSDSVVEVAVLLGVVVADVASTLLGSFCLSLKTFSSGVLAPVIADASWACGPKYSVTEYRLS